MATEADRKADRKRYAKDKKKRIAAETAYKKKVKQTPAGAAKIKARAKVNNAVRDGRMEKPGPNMDFHHTSISKSGTGKGRWVKGKGPGSHRRYPNSKDAKVR